MSTNGIGMKAMLMKASVLLAQSMPSFSYIAFANRGKPAPKHDRMKSLPASTLPTNLGYASPWYDNSALNSAPAPIEKNALPMKRKIACMTAGPASMYWPVMICAAGAL